MSKCEKTLFRLLGDLERLAEEETLAIKKQNTDHIQELQLQKSVIIASLAAANETLNVEQEIAASFRERFALVMDKLRKNSHNADKMYYRLEKELTEKREALRKLCSFKKAV